MVEHPLDVGRVRGSSPLPRTLIKMNQETQNTESTEQMNFIGIGLTILVIVILAFFIDMGSLRVWVEKVGIWGPIVFILLKISTVVVAPLSGSPLYPLAGLIFGFWPGILYIAIGDFIAHTSTFYISRIFGQKIVLKLLSDTEEGILARIVNHISDTRGFFHACLTFFAIPEVLSYGAGLSRLSYLKFIGILMPLLIMVASILVFFGSILKPDSESIFVALIIPVLGVLAVIIGGTLFMKSIRKKKAE